MWPFKKKEGVPNRLAQSILDATIGRPPGDSDNIPSGYRYVDTGDVYMPDDDPDWALYSEIYEDENGNRIVIKQWGLI